MITILTWLWKQENARIEYTTAHVNKWAKAIRKNATVPHRVAVVTDITEGLDPSIDVITPPQEFLNIKCRQWSERDGLPQCYRRIAMFSPHAAEIFGPRFMCMDLDALITGSIDHLLTRTEDFLIFRGTAAKRPYNGGLIIMDAGARPQVYEQFSAEKAREASSLYVGSDQAWISHCLGRGETTIGEAEGVTHYGPRFVRENGGYMDFTPPGNVCILFFPGFIKAFNGVSEIWGGKPEDIAVLQSVIRGRPPQFLAYDDPKGWGRMMAKHGFKLVSDTSKAKAGDRLFIRLDQQGEQRDISKMLAAVAADKGVGIFPNLLDAQVYDDKVAQINVLAEWLPQTFYCTDLDNALLLIDHLEFPLISKSAEGAGSANIRLLKAPKDAHNEAVNAFGDGIPLSYGRVQKGYVYWQKLIPENDRDYRVVITGDYAHGLVRYNRPDTVFASGSGRNYPITLKDEREQIAMRLGIEAAQKIGTRWCAFDIVFDENNQPYILEMSAAWTVKSYAQCHLYTYDLQETNATGLDIFAIAAREIKGEATPTAESVEVEILQPYQVRMNGTDYGKKGDKVMLARAEAAILLKNRVIEPIPTEEKSKCLVNP